MTREGELPRLVLRAVLGVLVLGAASVLGSGLLARTSGASGSERSRGFQRLVGGLGLGTAVDLSGDPAAFDERLGARAGPASPRLAAAYLGDHDERATRR